MFPKARQTDLSVRSLPDETLIYDVARAKAHCLNRTAALIWQHCDGQTSPAELARIVRTDLGIDKPEAVVRLALEQLSRRYLLEQPMAPLDDAARISRRRVLKKLALAAVVLPLVITVSGQNSVVQASGREVLMFLGKPCIIGGTAPQCGPYKCLPAPPTQAYINLPVGTGLCG